MGTAAQVGSGVIEEAELLLERARYREATALAGRALGGAASADAEARLRLVRGRALWQLGSVAPGRAEVRRALERAESGEARARALEAAAVLDWREQRFDEAVSRVAEARGAYRESGSTAGEWRTLGAEAGLLRDTGRLDEALGVLERRVALSEERGRPADLAQALSERGVLLTALGRWEAARRDFDASVAGFEALGDPRELGLARVSRATLDIANGELAAARVALEQAREAERRGGQSPRPLAEILMLLSDIELAAGDAGAGDALAAEALSLFALVHDRRGECWARMRRVHALLALGRVEDAAREGRRAVRLAEGLRLAVAAWAQLALGRALLRAERTAAAPCFEAALSLRSGRSDLAHAARLGRALAEGEPASPQLGAALEALAVWGDRRILAHCVADVRLLLGRVPEIAGTGAAMPGPAAPRVLGESAFPEILGRCDAMQALFEEMARVAPSEIAIHIAGETGTGKERVAEALHRRSRRAGGPFVAVNASSVGDELFEAEMFGHARGAFTGAAAAREGYVAAAEGGTLFIDELADLSPRAQAKLLRLLQEREYRRVGENEVRRADVRVLTATNADLEERVRSGAFREDLLYRLSVVTLRLPPLRERGEDVLLLARHFLRRAAEREGAPQAELPADVARVLVRHGWPGNVRELENEMSRLLVLSGPGPLSAANLSARVRGGDGPATRFSLRDAVRGFEREFVRGALHAHGGSRARTALALGLTRQALLNKLRRLGIA